MKLTTQLYPDAECSYTYSPVGPHATTATIILSLPVRLQKHKTAASDSGSVLLTRQVGA